MNTDMLLLYPEEHVPIDRDTELDNIEETDYKKNNMLTVFASLLEDHVVLRTQLETSFVATVNNPDSTALRHSFAYGSGAGGELYKLPKNELPRFDGEPYDFPAWSDRWQASVGASTRHGPAQKLEYLKQSLSGEPLEMIKHLKMIDGNYQIAMDALNGRYQNFVLISARHMDELLNLPKMKNECAKHIRTIKDTFKANMSALENLGHVMDHFLFVHMCTAKMDAKSQYDWELTMNSTDYPSFDKLADFMETRARAWEKIEGGTVREGGPSKLRTPFKVPQKQSYMGGADEFNSMYAFGTERKPSVWSTSQNICFCCKDPRCRPWFCKKFGALDVQGRQALVLQNRVCVKCLNPLHGSQPCDSRARLCSLCNGKHHMMLHSEAPGLGPQNLAVVPKNSGRWRGGGRGGGTGPRGAAQS
jgi:hypothetical protein